MPAVKTTLPRFHIYIGTKIKRIQKYFTAQENPLVTVIPHLYTTLLGHLFFYIITSWTSLKLSCDTNSYLWHWELTCTTWFPPSHCTSKHYSPVATCWKAAIMLSFARLDFAFKLFYLFIFLSCLLIYLFCYFRYAYFTFFNDLPCSCSPCHQ